jgi:hypothetical protein
MPDDDRLDGNGCFEWFATWYPSHNKSHFIQCLYIVREHFLAAKSGLLGKFARTFSNLH